MRILEAFRNEHQWRLGYKAQNEGKPYTRAEDSRWRLGWLAAEIDDFEAKYKR